MAENNKKLPSLSDLRGGVEPVEAPTAVPSLDALKSIPVESEEEVTRRFPSLSTLKGQGAGATGVSMPSLSELKGGSADTLTAAPSLKALKGEEEPQVPRAEQARADLAVQFDGVDFESIYKNQSAIDVMRRFYDMGEDVSDEDVVDHFINDRVWKDANEVSIGRELIDAYTSDDDRKRDMAYLRVLWDEMPMMWEEGGRGVLKGTFDNLWKGALSPSILLGGVLGKAGGWITGKVAGKAAGVAANKALGTFTGRVASQAAADALVTGGANLALQGVEKEVGIRDELSMGQAAAAAAVGAGASLAGDAIGAGIQKSFTKYVANPVDDWLGTMDVDTRSVINGLRRRILHPDAALENAPYKIVDVDGKELMGFQSERGAKVALAKMDPDLVKGRGVQIVTGGDKIHSPKAKFVNRYIDYLRSIEDLSATAGKAGRPNNALDAAQTVKIAQNAPMVAKMFSEQGGAFRYDLYGKGGFSWVETSKGLGEILDELNTIHPDMSKEFGTYFFYKRLLQKEGAMEGFKKSAFLEGRTGLGDAETVKAAKSFVTEFQKKFGKEGVDGAEKAMQTLNKQFMDFMVDTGVMSPELAGELLDSNAWYLPIHRAIDPSEQMAGHGTASSSMTVHKMSRGVGQDTESVFFAPLAAYKQNMEASILKAMENARYMALIRDIERMPKARAAQYGEWVPKEVISQKIGGGSMLGSLKDALRQANVDHAEIDTIEDILKKADRDFFTAWTSKNPNTGKTVDGSYIVQVFDKGETKFFKFRDPLLASSVEFMQQGAKTKPFNNKLFQWAQAATGIFQHFIVRDPEFVLGTSMLTDTFTSWAYSKGFNWKTLPAINLIRGWSKTPGLLGSDDLAKNRTLREALANGVSMGGVVADTGPEYIAKIINRQSTVPAKYGAPVDGAKKAVKDFLDPLPPNFDADLARVESGKAAPWLLYRQSKAAPGVVSRSVGAVTDTAKAIDNKLSDFAQQFEGSPRINEWTRLMEGGMAKGEAAAQAIDSNIDFRRRGTDDFINSAMALIPFMNAIKNVNYRLVRGIDPTGRLSSKATAAKLTALTGAIAIYTLGVKEDPRYQALDEETRHRYWVFFDVPGMGGEALKLRKPDDLAAFGNAIEQVLMDVETTNADPYEAAADALKTLTVRMVGSFRNATGEDAILNLTPYAVRPLAEIALNQKFGGPIVPSYLEEYFADVPAEQYYDGSTPPAAVELGKWLNFSPLAIESVMRGYLGPAAKYGFDVNKLTDPSTATSLGLDDLPILRRFLVTQDEPQGSSSWSDRFYDLRQEAAAVKKAPKGFLGVGKPEKAEAYLQEVENDPEKQVKLAFANVFEKVSRDIGTMRKDIRRFQNSDATPQQKKAYRDALNFRIQMLQEFAVRTYHDALDEELGKQADLMEKMPDAFYQGQMERLFDKQ